MTAENFTYWLQGYLEMGNPETISEEDLNHIKGHLSLAFKDDIDKSYGDSKHKEKLNNIHNFTLGGDNDERMRC